MSVSFVLNGRLCSSALVSLSLLVCKCEKKEVEEKVSRVS